LAFFIGGDGVEFKTLRFQKFAQMPFLGKVKIALLYILSFSRVHAGLHLQSSMA